MSILKPVSLAASRAFWPSLPMARESWSSGTTTRQLLPSGRGSTLITSAGERAAAMYSAGSSEYLIMSIFSPLSSSTMVFTRWPRGPTQAPMGSTLGSADQTASLVREPASRATDLISTVPSKISGTSSSKRRFTRPGWVREMRTWGPLVALRTSTMYTFSRWPST